MKISNDELKGKEIEQQRKQAESRAEKCRGDSLTWKSLYEDMKLQAAISKAKLTEIETEMDNGGCQYAIRAILKKVEK